MHSPADDGLPKGRTYRIVVVGRGRGSLTKCNYIKLPHAWPPCGGISATDAYMRLKIFTITIMPWCQVTNQQVIIIPVAAQGWWQNSGWFWFGWLTRVIWYDNLCVWGSMLWYIWDGSSMDVQDMVWYLRCPLLGISMVLYLGWFWLLLEARGRSSPGPRRLLMVMSLIPPAPGPHYPAVGNPKSLSEMRKVVLNNSTDMDWHWKNHVSMFDASQISVQLIPSTGSPTSW